MKAVVLEENQNRQHNVHKEFREKPLDGVEIHALGEHVEPSQSHQTDQTLKGLGATHDEEGPVDDRRHERDVHQIHPADRRKD